jgi:hypothetical protein
MKNFLAMHGEIVTSQILDLSRDNQTSPMHTHLGKFIATSHFISFEPLIVPVSMHLLPLCRLTLDEAFLSRPTSDSHTLSHDNSQEDQEEDHKDKDLVSSQVRVSSFESLVGLSSRFSFNLSSGGQAAPYSYPFPSSSNAAWLPPGLVAGLSALSMQTDPKSLYHASFISE